MNFNKNENILVTILVPCYNEEENIDIFHQELFQVVQQYRYKIIFIDDGSTDQTLSKLKFLSAVDNNVFYISLSRNFGHQVALKAGYDYAGESDCVICLDADLQQPPIIINDMIAEWRNGYQIINAIRKKNERLSFFKRYSARLFYKMVNSFSKHKIVPNGPDFRLLDKNVVKVIISLKEHDMFLREIISWIGFKQTTVAFDVQKRRFGKSKYSLRKMLSLSLKAFFAYGLNPLRLAIFIGIFLSLFSFSYGFYAIFSYLYEHNTVPGWTSIMASFLFIAGFQFILIGVIGEYLGKTYMEAKKRPIYLINDHNLGQLLNDEELL